MERKRTSTGVRLLAAVLLLVCVQPAVFAAETIDVLSPDVQALNRLNELYGVGLPNGQILTREDFCVILAKTFYENYTEQPSPPFADINTIKQGNEPYIFTLYNSAVLSGTNENGVIFMKPDEKITRQEAFTMLGKVLKQTSDVQPPFTDADSISPWALGYVAWFAENGILSGYSDGSLRPSNTITSAHAAFFILKAKDYMTHSSVNVASYFGTGSRGLQDGTANNARFTLPYGVTTDNSGNLIVLDTYNNTIRKISQGMSETVSGSVKALDEQRFPKGYYLDGSLNDALLNRPTSGVYNPGGDLLICDSANNVIRLIKGGEMFTLTGMAAGYADGPPGSAKFNNPQAIAVDKDGNIYVADTLNNCIRKIDVKGNTETIAGIPGNGGYANGSASTAQFLNPSGIAVSDDGKTVYVSDTSNHIIRKIENGQVTTIAGTTVEKDEDGYPLGGLRDGSAISAMFSQPLGLALEGGLLIIADSGNNKIRALTGDGWVVTVAGSGEPGDTNGNALTAELNHPSGVHIAGGTLYIADTTNNKIKSMLFNADLYK